MLLTVFLCLSIYSNAFGYVDYQITELWRVLEETKEELRETKLALSNTNKKLEELSQECVPRSSGIKDKRLLDNIAADHQLELDIQTLKASVAKLQSQMVTVTQGTLPKVGFTAYINNDISNLGDNQVLIFDHVVTNDGNGYSQHTGVFTCQFPGLYVFYVHTLAEPGKHVQTIIKRNSNEMAYTFAYDKETFSSGSNMAVMTLVQGDKVFIMSHGNHHSTDGAILDYIFTSFSGFMIHN